MRDAMLHLLARYREMRPLFLACALPMKEEWKIKPYFGVLPLVFSAEESLLGAEDLDGGGGVLGKVGERARVRDEAGAHDVADQRGEVRRNLIGDWTDYKSARMIAERVRVKQEGAFGVKQKSGGALVVSVGRVCQSGACKVSSRRLQIRSVIGET